MLFTITSSFLSRVSFCSDTPTNPKLAPPADSRANIDGAESMNSEDEDEDMMGKNYPGGGGSFETTDRDFSRLEIEGGEG